MQNFVHQYHKSQIRFVYNLTFLALLLAKNVGNYFLGKFYEMIIPELKIEFSPHKRLNKL